MKHLLTKIPSPESSSELIKGMWPFAGDAELFFRSWDELRTKLVTANQSGQKLLFIEQSSVHYLNHAVLEGLQVVCKAVGNYGKLASEKLGRLVSHEVDHYLVWFGIEVPDVLPNLPNFTLPTHRHPQHHEPMFKLQIHNDGKVRHQSFEARLAHEIFDLDGYGANKDEAIMEAKAKVQALISELQSIDWGSFDWITWDGRVIESPTSPTTPTGAYPTSVVSN